jgi:Cu(I)/Ag(I) efflux system membrane protein CusA/SilA
VASIGGFVRPYQVRLDPDKLRAYNIPLSTVIDRVRDSTNEVGGRLIELGGAEYTIRGLGYLRSLSDLETVPVASKNGTPVLVRDLGTVSFGPDIRRGVAEWNGEGETVGGIVVMRHGQNALNVISGVKQKVAQISGSLPPGVEIVSGYDRSGVMNASIDTLKRDLIEEAVIVSVAIIVFLFHFRSAFIPILTLPIAVIASFIAMTTSRSAPTLCPWAAWRWRSVSWWTPRSSWSRMATGIFQKPSSNMNSPGASKRKSCSMPPSRLRLRCSSPC